MIEATKNYRSNRENGSDVDNPKHLLPLDGSFRWVNPDEENDAQLRYDEGSGDKAWMEEKDRNYLARLRKGESFSLLNALFLLFPRSVNMQNIVELQKTGCANVTASDYASLVNVSDNAGFIAELIQNKYEKNVHIYVETLKQVWANAPLCLDIILYLNEEDIFSPPIKNSMRCTIL